jgi:hypothetical protein
MVRLLGILCGIYIAMQWTRVDMNMIVAALAASGLLTLLNLYLALREFRSAPASASMRAFHESLSNSNSGDLLGNLQSVVEETRAVREGRPLVRTLVRYLAVCFPMNFLIVFGVAGLIHLLR